MNRGDRMKWEQQIYHQRGESIMPQGILPYKYEEEKSRHRDDRPCRPPDLSRSRLGLRTGRAYPSPTCRSRTQGWTDEQIILSLILLNLAGGDSVDDLKVLEKDEGFCKVLGRIETKGLSRGQRREQERRWRKTTHRSVASPSAIFRYLAAFHDPEEENKRERGKAFIPSPNGYLQGLIKVNRDFVASVQQHRPTTEATLDM